MTVGNKSARCRVETAQRPTPGPIQVGVLSVPYDSGRCRERMGLGPHVLFRECLEPLFRKHGIIYRHEEVSSQQLHCTEIGSAFELCGTVSNRVRALKAEGCFPILLTGNCELAIGGICGCGVEDTAVAWFDAHGEANTPETTTSGFLDGMGIAILTGLCWRAISHLIPGFKPLPGRRVLLVGSRDVEPEEGKLLDKTGVLRIQRIADLSQAAADLRRETNGCYLHFDLDVLSPDQATANQWTPPGGMMLEEVLKAVEAIRDQLRVKGFGFGSYDPKADKDGRASRAATAIAELLLQEVA